MLAFAIAVYFEFGSLFRSRLLVRAKKLFTLSCLLCTELSGDDGSVMSATVLYVVVMKSGTYRWVSDGCNEGLEARSVTTLVHVGGLERSMERRNTRKGSKATVDMVCTCGCVHEESGIVVSCVDAFLSHQRGQRTRLSSGRRPFFFINFFRGRARASGSHPGPAVWHFRMFFLSCAKLKRPPLRFGDHQAR